MPAVWKSKGNHSKALHLLLFLVGYDLIMYSTFIYIYMIIYNYDSIILYVHHPGFNGSILHIYSTDIIQSLISTPNLAHKYIPLTVTFSSCHSHFLRPSNGGHILPTSVNWSASLRLACWISWNDGSPEFCWIVYCSTCLKTKIVQ